MPGATSVAHDNNAQSFQGPAGDSALTVFDLKGPLFYCEQSFIWAFVILQPALELLVPFKYPMDAPKVPSKEFCS